MKRVYAIGMLFFLAVVLAGCGSGVKEVPAPEPTPTWSLHLTIQPEDLYDVIRTDWSDPSVAYLVTGEQKVVLAHNLNSIVQDYRDKMLPTDEQARPGITTFQEPWPEGLAYPTKKFGPGDLNFTTEKLAWWTDRNREPPLAYTVETGGYRLVVPLWAMEETVPTNQGYWMPATLKFFPWTGPAPTKNPAFTRWI